MVRYTIQKNHSMKGQEGELCWKKMAVWTRIVGRRWRKVGRFERYLWYRLHRLVNLEQGDEQEASPDFMGPEAYETAEFLQKLISCIKEGPKMAGRGPETLETCRTQWGLDEEEEGLPFLHLSLLRGNTFPRILHSISLKCRRLDRKIDDPFQFWGSLIVVGRKQFRQVHYHLWAKKAMHTHALVTKYSYCTTRYCWNNNLCLDNRGKLSCTQQIGKMATLSIMDMSDWVGSLFFLTSHLSPLMKLSSSSPQGSLWVGSDSSPHW